VAVKVADTLRGKNKVIYTPGVDCGDYVIVKNARHIILTGNKMENKK
jgi:large subunit ribosomal protein L13